MQCAHEATLHARFSGELDEGTRALLDAHLGECPECQETAARTRSALVLLRTAAHAAPAVDWRRADDAVMSAATLHFARRARWNTPLYALAGMALCAALVLVVWAPWRAPAVPVTEPLPAFAGVSIEASEGASLAVGDAVRPDSPIRTDERGTALVRLPEQSRARLGARSQVTVARATPEEIALALDEGSVAVKAAHAQRREFLVTAAKVQVRVVGTVFRVTHEGDDVSVSVAEGRVLVEPRDGQSLLVDAGRRVRVSSEGTVEEEALKPEDDAAFLSLGVIAAPPPKLAAAPDRTARPVRRSKTRADPVPVDAAPSSSPEEWATPDFGAAPPSPEPAESPVALTAEGLFLERAHAAIKTGRCGNFLVGLQDITEGSEDTRARELARILRARCFDERLQPVRAEQEFRRYLQQFPDGRYSGEARRAVTP